jgi:hypothetical protein
VFTVRLGIVLEIAGVAGIGVVAGPATAWWATVPPLFVYGLSPRSPLPPSSRSGCSPASLGRGNASRQAQDPDAGPGQQDLVRRANQGIHGGLKRA